MVFPAIGDDFICEAGLVNGDRALKCSDDWAVVVNGDDDDIKSLCRVHLESGVSRCLGAPKEGLSDEELILPMQRSSWDGYQSGRDNNRQFAPGDSAKAALFQDPPPGAQISYTSQDSAICLVDDEGTVSIDENTAAPETCKIVMKVEAEGVADRVFFVELPILKSQVVGWEGYIRSNNYFYPGESLEAEAVTSSISEEVEWQFVSLNDDICTVDDEGMVEALTPGDCVVRLIARAQDYLDVVIDQVIPVDAPARVFTDIAWDDFKALDGATALVGADIPALTAPVAKNADGDASAALSFAVSGNCDYDSSTRIISFSDATECVITVTASSANRHEASYSKDFSFTPGPGTFVLTWAGYANGNAAVYDFNPPAPATASITPANLSVEYSYSATEGGCEVDGTTGVLTLVGATEGTTLSCDITLSAVVRGYGEQSQSRAVAPC